MGQNLTKTSKEARQTRFSDVCGCMDELKRLLNEEYDALSTNPHKMIQPLLEDTEYMLLRMERRMDEYKIFQEKLQDVVQRLAKVQKTEVQPAMGAAEFIRNKISTSDSFKKLTIKEYEEKAEAIRWVANNQEAKLRIYKDLWLAVLTLFEQVKGNRNWTTLSKEEEENLFVKLKNKYQAWLPPQPHRDELLKKLVEARADVEEAKNPGEEPVVHFEDGGSIPMSKVRYDSDIGNFHPASFKPGKTGRKYRE